LEDFFNLAGAAMLSHREDERKPDRQGPSSTAVYTPETDTNRAVAGWRATLVRAV